MNYQKEIINTQKNYFTEFNETNDELLKNLKNYLENKENKENILSNDIIHKLIIMNNELFSLRNKLEELNYEILTKKVNFTDQDKEYLHEYNQRKYYEKKIKEFILNKYILENF